MTRGKELSCALILFSAGCLLAPGCLYLCPLGQPKAFQEVAFDRVVDRIRSGSLRPDRRGVVVLPGRLASLSATGRVYVRRWPNGRLIVFFPSWVGRQSLLVGVPGRPGDNWLQGYVYDSRPESRKHLGAKAAKDESEDDYPFVLGPPRNPPWRAIHDRRAELRDDLEPLQRLDEHWWYEDIVS